MELQDPQQLRISGSTEELLDQVGTAIAELNQYRPFNDEVDERVRTTLLPDRMVASLNMEGIVATRRQTLAVMDAMRLLENIGRAEREIRNALQADDLIQHVVDERVELSEQLVREINRRVLADVHSEAGEYRKAMVELPGAPFPPAAPGDIPALVQSLCVSFRSAEHLHPVMQAAWLHAQFTMIHPFSDGNGRGGRLMQDFALVRRGLLPIGIPPSQRDDYYAALEAADTGDWDSFVEMLALLELAVIGKTIAIARAPEKRATWIQRLASAAAQRERSTHHKRYVVWRQRMEGISRAFAQATQELDVASDAIGAAFKDFGVVEFAEWRRICKRGFAERSWLFSILVFAENQPFYKLIAFLRRHNARPQDPFDYGRDNVALYFTGVVAPGNERPNFTDYSDPHIRLRELLYRDEALHLYRQGNPEEEWDCVTDTSVETVVEDFFTDVFTRKAGLAG